MSAISVRTSYSGPTDTRGSRILVSWDGRRRAVPFSYAASDAHMAAIAEVFHLTGAELEGIKYTGTTRQGSHLYAVTLPPAPVVVTPQGYPTAALLPLPIIPNSPERYKPGQLSAIAGYPSDSPDIPVMVLTQHNDELVVVQFLADDDQRDVLAGEIHAVSAFLLVTG